METLVLPPQDELVRRHYWHNNIKKTREFHPISVISSRSRRRPSANAFLHLSENQTDLDRIPFRNSNLDRVAVASPNVSDGLLPIPGCSTPDNIVSSLHSPSVLRSIDRSSASLQSCDSSPHIGESETNNSGRLICEVETVRRPYSSSGRTNTLSKKERIDRFAEANVDNMQTWTVGMERTPSFCKPRTNLRTAKSLPEQVVTKFENGKGLGSEINSKQRRLPAVEPAEKKVYKEKKNLKKNEADKGLLTTSVFQGNSPENVPAQVTILQRPDSREEALRNLARFKGIPLSELCAKNGELVPSDCENVVPKACSLDLASIKGKVTHDSSVFKGGFDSVTSTPKQNRLSRRHSSFERIAGMMKESDLLSPCNKAPNSCSSAVGTLSTASNGVNKFTSEEIFPAQVTKFSTDELYNSPLWTAEILAEKWAGPSYTASPPPSSLPIPKFRLQRQSPLEVVACDTADEFSVKSSTLMSTERVQVLSKPSARDAKHVEMDTELATKDLRRMLHLDF